MPERKRAVYGLLLFLSCFCLFGLALKPVMAEALPPGLLIGDDSGIYVDGDGTYYIDLAEVQPGDRYEKEITIRSLDLEEPFDLGLLVSKEAETGPLDWNEHVTLTLTLDDKEIYQGPLLGNGQFDWTVTPLELGTCTYGTDKILHAVFEVDTSLTVMDFLEQSELLYQWTFVGVREPTASSESQSSESSSSQRQSSEPKQPTGKLPQTGEQTQPLALFLGGFLILCIGLLLLKKRREEKDE